MDVFYVSFWPNATDTPFWVCTSYSALPTILEHQNAPETARFGVNGPPCTLKTAYMAFFNVCGGLLPLLMTKTRPNGCVFVLFLTLPL